MAEKSHIFKPGKQVYGLGIGGIGVSAVFRWLQHIGLRVSGEDATSSAVTDQLEKDGIPVTIGQAENLPDRIDVVVYSDAVPDDHPVRREAFTRNVPQYSYAETLGILTRPYDTIAVAGTHGKSTTTAILGILLEAAGVDPTVVVGTRIPQWGNRNFRLGNSTVALVEADEHNRHFLELSPSCAIVTNVDYDHADVFETQEIYVEAFQDFISRTSEDGTVILQETDPETQRLMRGALERNVVTFGLANQQGEQSSQHSVIARDIRQTPEGTKFRVIKDNQSYGEFLIRIPGIHMVLNATAAIAAASQYGASYEDMNEALKSFTGTWRRFEVVGEYNGAPVISDYAHHPTEISALLEAARQYAPERRVVLVFQPHHRVRVQVFEKAFIESFCKADYLILNELYDVPGRNVGQEMSTNDWVPQITKHCDIPVEYAKTLDDAESIIRTVATPSDLIIIAGAGSIDNVARSIVQQAQ